MSLTIKRLSTSGGYLQGTQIEFSDRLNCIIGARGTCKSTIVETIRFLFNSGRGRIAEMLEPEEYERAESASHKGLLRETLEGGVARCEIDFTDTDKSQSVILERDVSASEPRLYRDGIKELSDKGILNFIEIYSQGELQQIAEDGTRRLELIDRSNKIQIDELVRDRLEATNKLSEVGNRIRAIRARIESSRAEIKSLGAYQQQLNELEAKMPKLSSELEQERTKFAERTALLELASTLLTRRDSMISSTESLLPDSGEFGDAAKRFMAIEDPAAIEIGRLFEDFSRFIDNVKSASGKQSRNTSPLYRNLENAFEEQNTLYYQLRQSEEEVNESLRKQDQIRQQIVHLQRIQKSFQESEMELKQTEEERKRLRQDISRHSDTIFQLRLAQVDEVNRQFNDRVMLTITQGVRSGEYAKSINDALRGSRLREQEDIAKILSERVPPPQLIDIVESGDSGRLAELLDRDLGQMARLVSYLGDSPDLSKLENQLFEDELNITFFDEGIPKRVDQLSKGQKATAMLPLILRSANYPLIFDQPEDDLDNRFIYATLVEIIRILKTQRQIIFVTHNANIPVLGDAERVLVMKMENPKKAAQPTQGDVDQVKGEILSLLEGGADAFKRRQRKYGSLLKPE